MHSEPANSLLARLLMPLPFFIGVAAAFAACCLVGVAAGRRNHIKRFERFHVFLTPQTHFYPTACQVRALARSRLQRDKIAVVIGGSSILQGSWQPPDQLWTRRLQELLGDRYDVVNFGLCGARTCEFGATAAEILERDYRKLIFIADLVPGCMPTDPDGYEFKYFFWDAYCKGMLLRDPGRDARLKAMRREPEMVSESAPSRQASAATKVERQQELRAEMNLDRACRFNELWNTAAYTRCVTVWTYLTSGSFTRPRKWYRDNDRGPRPGHVVSLGDRGASIRNVLHRLDGPRSAMWADFERCASFCFPPAVRPHTLLLVTWMNPLYLRCLTTAEQTQHAAVSRLTVAHLRKLGFEAVEVGKDFAPADYADFCHLVASGGAKLAAAVAPEITRIAAERGYLK